MAFFNFVTWFIWCKASKDIKYCATAEILDACIT